METLDDRSCFEVISRRDRRFDGRFYTGVTSTGIFCRPSCPARTPKRSNVVFFRHPASALQQGFRPCRRCRPEFAPNNPEWNRRDDLLARVVSAVDSGTVRSVSQLAAKVAVGERHLRRELRAGLGTTAQHLLSTHRVMLARLLLDQTSLPITDVAFAAGYGSVRSFNEAISSMFGATPTRLRRERPNTCQDTASTIMLSLVSKGILKWGFLHRFFSYRAIDGLEESTKDSFRVAVPGGRVELSGSPDDTALHVGCQLDSVKHIELLLPRVKRMVDLDTDLAEVAHFFSSDTLLGPRLEVGVPPLPATFFSSFEGCVRAVVGQKISVAGARTLMSRLVAAVFKDKLDRESSAVQTSLPFASVDHFPTPEEILIADITKVGLTTRQQETLRLVAVGVIDGTIDLSETADSDRTQRALLDIAGVGSWTAGYVAMRGLADPDGWPTNDLVLRKSASTTKKELERMCGRWKPWRAYAALLLWSTNLESE